MWHPISSCGCVAVLDLFLGILVHRYVVSLGASVRMSNISGISREGERKELGNELRTRERVHGDYHVL